MDQLCIEQPHPESIVKLNDQVIENVEVFCYLGDGICFDQPSTGDASIDLRIAVVQNKYNQMSKKLRNRKIYLKTGVYIMNVMVRNCLNYSCQTWNINKQQQKRIRSAYTSLLRRMVKGGFKRKVDKNDEDA